MAGSEIKSLTTSDLILLIVDMEDHVKRKMAENTYLSRHAKDLVCKLILSDPDSRLSAKEALLQPWFEDSAGASLLNNAHTKMQERLIKKSMGVEQTLERVPIQTISLEELLKYRLVMLPRAQRAQSFQQFDVVENVRQRLQQSVQPRRKKSLSPCAEAEELSPHKDGLSDVSIASENLDGPHSPTKLEGFIEAIEGHSVNSFFEYEEDKALGINVNAASPTTTLP